MGFNSEFKGLNAETTEASKVFVQPKKNTEKKHCSHCFIVWTEEGWSSYMKFGKWLPLYFADINNRLQAVEIKFVQSAERYMNKLNFTSHFYRIYNKVVPYLENSIVSVKATTSDLSFVTVKSPIPMSVAPMYTSDTIPFHDPLLLEPYKSVS